MPAGRRITIRVVDEDPAMRNTSFGTFVTSTNAVPVVAERAMWWRSYEGQWTAGHVGVGFTAGGKKWVTADGVAAADGSNDTYALITNTEARAGMLKVTALFDDGTAPVEKLFAIGAAALHHPRPAAVPGSRRQGLQLRHRVDRRHAGGHRGRPLDLLGHGRALLGDGHDVAGLENQVVGSDSIRCRVARGRQRDLAPPFLCPRLLRMHLLLLVMAVIWGANYSLIKIVLRELPPPAFNALRLIVASASTCCARVHGADATDAPEWLQLAGSGSTASSSTSSAS